MGVAYSVRLKRRVVILEKTRIMIEEMKIQLRYLNVPLYDMLKSMRKKEYLQKLSIIAESCDLIDKGSDFHTAWKYAVENTALPYKTDETDRLLHLGLNLGVSDAENQLRILALESEYFDQYISEAKLSEKKYGSLTTTLGILSGCMIFILMT